MKHWLAIILENYYVIITMALHRKQSFKKEEVLVWCWLMADGWWNLSDIDKSFHNVCTLWSAECWCQKGPGFPPSFVTHVGPIM